MPRIFIGIPTPQEFLPALQDWQAALAGQLPNQSFRRENLANSHLTLLFLGEVEPLVIERLHAELVVLLTGEENFLLELGELGRFPPSGKTRVLWLGLGPLDRLRQLKEKVDIAAKAAGLVPDRQFKDFIPHLSLIRFREPILLRAQPTIAHHDLSAPAGSIVLFESQLTPAGAIHTQLQEYQLATPPVA